jgi:hypothetical protein
MKYSTNNFTLYRLKTMIKIVLQERRLRLNPLTIKFENL